jgi:predicted kinase
MPRLTVLMGAPGSGKSTYAKKSGATVVTTDGARERGQKPGDTLHNAYRQINAALASGKDVVFDTTGANPAVRKAAATIAARHGAMLDAHVIDTPVNVCVQSQAGRACPVAAGTVQRIHADVRKAVGGLKAEGFRNVTVQNRK